MLLLWEWSEIDCFIEVKTNLQTKTTLFFDLLQALKRERSESQQMAPYFCVGSPLIWIVEMVFKLSTCVLTRQKAVEDDIITAIIIANNYPLSVSLIAVTVLKLFP